MKAIFVLIFGVCSIFCFGQSDLEIQPNYVANGLTSAPNYRHNRVRWSFDVTNIGTIEAGIVSYSIYFSTDNVLNANDLIVHTGNLGDDNLILPSSGINANTTVQVPSYLVTEVDFYIPWNYEANEEYFFIFTINQDVSGGEVNLSNNTSVLPFYLTLDDKLKIQHVDYTVELGNKTPLLLIHGWQPDGYDAPGDTSIWDNFLFYFNSDIDLTQNFKPYFVKYNSNILPVNDLGHELRIDLDNWFGTDYTGNISIIAHSMGGLVSRSFMNRNRDIGPHANNKGGDRINKLITLGTPHHGSPMANGPIRLQANTQTSYLIPSFLLNALDNNYYGLSVVGGTPHREYNRWDLRWDNYDGYWSEGVYSSYIDEHNEWLNSDKMNLNTEFDNKIIAYGGFITSRSIFSISPNPTSGFYFLVEPTINLLGFPLNDGVVPYSSATYENHFLDKVRLIPNRYHDEMAKGRFDLINSSGTDEDLFSLIKTDLLGNVSNAFVISSIENEYTYPDTALINTSSKDIIIQNTGDLPLTVTSIQLIGSDNAQFNFNFPSVPFTILPNESQTFTVGFEPTSIGEKTVTFRVNNSSNNNPQLDIQLSGLAVQTATTDYNTNTNSSYDFGDVYIYGGSGLTTMSISNSSSAPYVIDDLNIVGLDASMFTIVQQSTLPITLNPGDTVSTILSFDPDSIGEKNAVIEIHFENYSIPVTATLMGNGVNTINNPIAPKLTNYEYWYNNDYASRQSVSLTGNNSAEQLAFLASPSSTTNGLNKLHFRIKDNEGSWSSVSTDYVYIQNATNGTSENQILSYEYWFDDDYSNKISGNTTQTTLVNFNSDINNVGLSKGLHKFHIRFKDNKNTWSSISTDFIYNLNDNNFGLNKIVAYRYWFNDDFAGHIHTTITPEIAYLLESIDVIGLQSNSTNYIHFQFKDTYGNWSSVLTEEFINTTLNIPENEIEILKLYPNPTNATVNLKSSNLEGVLKVYNSLGQIVSTFNEVPKQVDMSNYESGLYIFLIESTNKTYQGKIIKF